MDVKPLSYRFPIVEQTMVLNLKTPSSGKKRKVRDPVLDFMQGYRQRKNNNGVREPSDELLDCDVAYASADDNAKEVCVTKKVSEVKQVYVAYAADNHSEKGRFVFQCWTGFPKKPRSVPSDDTTTSTATSSHQHGTDQVKPQINVTTLNRQHRTDQVKPQINVPASMSDKEDEKQNHQKQQRRKKKLQKKETSKDKKMRANGKKAKGKQAFPEPTPPQEVPQTIRNTISALGGTSPVWLSEKILYKSDILPQQARIFLPVSLALEEFLTPAEREKYLVLKNSEDEKKRKDNALIVTVVDPKGETSEMKFKNWGSLNKYVLAGANWNNLVAKFHMEAVKTKLQFWCFRKTGSSKLCFAINMIIEDKE